jgi:hypothetical protein
VLYEPRFLYVTGCVLVRGVTCLVEVRWDGVSLGEMASEGGRSAWMVCVMCGVSAGRGTECRGSDVPTSCK